MQNFIGRKNELDALEKRYRKRRSEFVVIYGRKRVGKSTLIQEFSKGKLTLYIHGSRSSAHLQRKHFLETCAIAFSEPLFRDLAIDNWDNIFKTITEYIENKIKKKVILTLDEFPWMCQSSPELPSLIQKCWDTKWQKSKRLFIIICGSYLGFMEREILGKKSPLFGRRTGQILLKSFDYIESKQFHTNLINRALVYSFEHFSLVL